MRWKTLSGEKIKDIAQWIKDNDATGKDVHIGTDSLNTGRFTQFVTVVIIYTPTKGGRVAYTREVVPRMTSLRERLVKEVWKSVSLGMELDPAIQGKMSIHVDANVDPKYASSRYVQELAGMVVGQGFSVVLKPDSWAACHAADHVVRTRGKLPK